MNVRLAVHLVISITVALPLVFVGLNLAGPFGAALGFVVWFLLEQLIKALVPTSFHARVAGAQVTAAVYRGWAARLIARTPLAGRRTPAVDAARLAEGYRLGTLTYRLSDANHSLGYLLMQKSPEGTPMLAWRPRGKNATALPIDRSAATHIFTEHRQHNSAMNRFGYTEPVQLGQDLYCLRPHDLALLNLFLDTAITDPAQAAG